MAKAEVLYIICCPNKYGSNPYMETKALKTQLQSKIINTHYALICLSRVIILFVATAKRGFNIIANGSEPTWKRRLISKTPDWDAKKSDTFLCFSTFNVKYFTSLGEMLWWNALYQKNGLISLKISRYLWGWCGCLLPAFVPEGFQS